MFKEREEGIINFVKEIFPNYSETDFEAYVNDFIDLDKYKYDTMLFFNFGSYAITPLTNESGAGSFSFDIYMVFRNDESEVLKDRMTEFADAFFQMFKENGFNFGGVIDGTMETEIYFFNAAEGNPNTKICQMTFTTTSEM